MRLIIISLSTLVFVFMILGIARFWGLGHHERTFTSKFWQTTTGAPIAAGTTAPQSEVATAEKSSPSEAGKTLAPKDPEIVSPQAIEIIVPWEQSFFLEKRPSLILWAKAYLNNRNSILVMPSVDTFVKVNRDLEQSDARPALEELLKKFPETRFLIEFNDNKSEVDEMLAKAVDNAKASERIIIQSNYNIILESTKKLLPLALFGTGTADIMRMGVFESLFILPSAPFKGDVFIFGLHKMGVSLGQLSESWIKEMKRRNKKVIVAVNGQDSDIQLAVGLGADGLILQKPELLIK